ncbi:Glycosyltransferase domain-containing protein [Forsythia ovata]|uniref:Glycosyltransferase domain-containing protein n=1 Tax=Forsythia ovata TaxID=205694 RepID=A0ABD1X117_9LAMI
MRSDDVDVVDRLPILNDTYYRDILLETGGMFALAIGIDNIHKRPWIGFQSLVCCWEEGTCFILSHCLQNYDGFASSYAKWRTLVSSKQLGDANPFLSGVYVFKASDSPEQLISTESTAVGEKPNTPDNDNCWKENKPASDLTASIDLFVLQERLTNMINLG